MKEEDKKIPVILREDISLSDLSDEEEKEWIRKVRLQDAKKEGSQEKEQEIVLRMHDKKMTNEIIAEYTGLSLKQVEEIIENRS